MAYKVHRTYYEEKNTGQWNTYGLCSQTWVQIQLTSPNLLT